MTDNKSQSCLFVNHKDCIDSFCICICHRYIGFKNE